MAGFGFCKDKWTDNDHRPGCLNIRAARRMKGTTVIRQKHITANRDKKEVIHIGFHFIDSHHVAPYPVDKDHFIKDGARPGKGRKFQYSLSGLHTQGGGVPDLLVRACMSSNAVDLRAIRLEPTWMLLGEVSGMAASLAIRDKVDVQKIDIKELQEKIVKIGIPLEVPESE